MTDELDEFGLVRDRSAVTHLRDVGNHLTFAGWFCQKLDTGTISRVTVCSSSRGVIGVHYLKFDPASSFDLLNTIEARCQKDCDASGKSETYDVNTYDVSGNHDRYPLWRIPSSSKPRSP